jgi:DNA-binding NtrC family response regulator
LISPQSLERQLQHPYILVVFPHTEDLGGILKAIAATGHLPLICHSLLEAQEVLKRERIQSIICEDHLPHGTIQAILKLAKHRHNPIPVIITSRTGGWKEYLEALQQGAFEYLALPPQPREVTRVLDLAFAESRRTSERGTSPSETRQFHASEFVLALGESKLSHDLVKVDTSEAIWQKLPR